MSAASNSSALQNPPREAPHIRLNVEQASYAYAADDHDAPLFTLEATTFQARQREVVAILGPNASGKSTLLRLVAGAIAPLSGRVQLEGVETSELDGRTRAQRIAVVQQESSLLFPARAWEYVLQGRYPHGRGLRFESAEDAAVAENALAQVGAKHLRDRWMDKISGGEKQRVILARALAQQLRRLAEENRYTVIVVTHELNLAAEFADQVVLLHRGKCLRVGPPAAVYSKELLENVFDAPLDVEISPDGKPHVIIRGRRPANTGERAVHLAGQ
jgi:iron complex transport system ATP-binding protein